MTPAQDNLISEVRSEVAPRQAISTEQINRTVLQIDENTQQNAAMVEEASSAALSLNALAKNLSQLTTFFTLDGSGTPIPTENSGDSGPRRTSC